MLNLNTRMEPTKNPRPFSLKQGICIPLAALILNLAHPAIVAAQSLQGSCANGSIDTAIGCVPIDKPENFTTFILGWAVGIAGGVGLLLIIYSAFQITTSSGDPKKLQAGQELLTATITGMLLIIFSVFLLRIIGVNILGIFT